MQDKILDLFEIEKKYNLINLKIDNIFIWQYLRGEIVYNVLNKISNNNAFFKTKIDIKYIKYIIKSFNIIKNSLFYNPFITFKKYDRIVFSHSRKSLLDGKYIDIYTNDMIDDKTLVIDSSFDEKFYTKYKRNTVINLAMFILRFFQKVDIDKNKIKNIENILYKHFGKSIEVEDLFTKHIKTFKAFFIIYNLLFKYLKPKEIIIVVNYGQAPLIKAAKDNGIKVIEMQHGNIDKYHYGYAYPYNKSIEYFPDYLYIFGEYFQTLNYIPLDKNKIKIHNYSLFSYKVKKFKNILKEKATITIISEATIMGGKLQKFILENVEFLKNYKVYYKLHPQEIVNNVYKYNVVTKQILDLDFIEVVSDQYDLYELLFKSTYIIAPASTVIYEALEVCCKIIVPKIEYGDILEELNEFILLAELGTKLNQDFINNYFNKIKYPPKGYFIESLKDI